MVKSHPRPECCRSRSSALAEILRQRRLTLLLRVHLVRAWPLGGAAPTSPVVKGHEPAASGEGKRRGVAIVCRATSATL